jgi:hypothetical protein
MLLVTLPNFGVYRAVRPFFENVPLGYSTTEYVPVGSKQYMELRPTYGTSTAFEVPGGLYVCSAERLENLAYELPDQGLESSLTPHSDSLFLCRQILKNKMKTSD